jgi:hypothetical protein
MFVLYVLSQIGNVRLPDLNPLNVPRTNIELLPVMVNTLIGACLAFAYQWIRGTRLVGILVVVITFSTLALSYFHFFINSGEQLSVPFTAFTLTLGMLLYRVLIPQDLMPRSPASSPRHQHSGGSATAAPNVGQQHP